jgi:hypothetical protein
MLIDTPLLPGILRPGASYVSEDGQSSVGGAGRRHRIDGKEKRAVATTPAELVKYLFM